MEHKLIELPYALNALEPTINQETMEYHWGKHLRGYVDNLNKLIKDTEYEDMSLDDIVEKSEGGLFNNAGQTLNHNLYFTQFCPKTIGEGKGPLSEAIIAQWGSIEDFKAEFNQKAITLFGAGWVWLGQDNDGKLFIKQYANAGNPRMDGARPILGIDVWEHAYYLMNRNRRAEHVENFWTIINWEELDKRYVKI